MVGERVYIGLGSNLGDRAAAIQEAVRMLAPAVSELRLSRLYETEPWGVREQPRYFNAVATGLTDLAPPQLLEAAQTIERTLGRDRSRELRWGPRTIDIDILLVGSRISTDRPPLLPHPRMAERAFVLVPLLELAPDLVDPRSGEPWSRALARLGGGTGVYPNTST